MPVGSIARPSSAAAASPLPETAPAPPSSGDAPIDMSRDVVDAGPATSARGPSAPAAIVRPPPARTFVDPQIHRAAEAFAEGGVPGLDTWVRQHPADVRWLLSVSRDTLEAGLQADLASRPGYGGTLGGVSACFDAHRISGHLADAAQPMIREAVRQVAVGRIDAMTDALESMSIDDAVAALRSAPAGSPLAALREALHLPGNSMDRERVESWVRTSREELEALRGTVMGSTWMPNEFPGSMAQVQRTLGLERAAPTSIAGEALFRAHGALAELAHTVETAIDTAMVGAEIVHAGTELTHGAHLAAHATQLARAGLVAESAEMSAIATLATETGIAASGGVAVGLAGLAFGYALHHQIEHNRAERTETAAALGL